MAKESLYSQAGVNIDAQDEAISNIKDLVRTTYTDNVRSDIGSFGGLFQHQDPDNPTLVASADGVGTKLKIAFMTGIYDTVGQDIVNHCIDDILVQGATPLFFLDYIATGKLEPNVVTEIVRGMTIACKENGCALLGGEMAEMPGFYKDGEFDIAGFIVGQTGPATLLPRMDKMSDSTIMVALPSVGLHTNGYSLVRKIVFDQAKLDVNGPAPWDQGKTVGQSLLTPHHSYLKALKPLLHSPDLFGMAHITGGGLLDNIPRVLPDHLDAIVDLKAIPHVPLFDYLVSTGNIDLEERYRVLNMGIGMVLMINEEAAVDIIQTLSDNGESPFILGRLAPGKGQVQLIE